MSNQNISTAMRAGNLRFKWVYKRADNGNLFNAEFLLSAIMLDGKLILQAFGRDSTERKQMEVQIRELEFFDPLNKLSSRRLLSDRLAQVESVNKPSGCYGAIMPLNLEILTLE